MDREIPFLRKEMEARLRLMYMMDIMTRYDGAENIHNILVDKDRSGCSLSPEFVRQKDIFGFNLHIDSITGANGRGLLGSFRVRETNKSFIIYVDVARISKKKLILEKLKGQQKLE